MICDMTEQKLAETLEFARDRGLLDNFTNKLKWLCGGPQPRRVFIFNDFTPHSFFWRRQRLLENGEWVDDMEGGLLYFTKGDSGFGAPNFSVRMNSDNEGWEIHT